MNGYPGWMVLLGLPMRPILRRFVLPRLLEGNSVQGVRTAGMFVQPENLDDSSELEKFENCVTEFKRSTSGSTDTPASARCHANSSSVSMPPTPPTPPTT